jgi:hypothetical protein
MVGSQMLQSISHLRQANYISGYSAVMRMQHELERMLPDQVSVDPQRKDAF